MVRRADEVCVEDLFPSGSCAAAIGFDGHNCPFLLAETRTFSSLRRVIAIPDSGQFFSLHLRQSTICETRALLLPGTEQTFDNANVRSATQEAPQELQHTRIVQSRARDCLR